MFLNHTDQMTPLMVCCNSGSSNEKSLVNVLKSLLSAGANLTVHDRWVGHQYVLTVVDYSDKMTTTTNSLTS